MPLGTIPPWLNVGPTDYLHAIQAGTQAGLEVNRQRALAEEAAARRELAQQESQRQAWEFGETMRQRAAQQAAEQALEREKLAQTSAYQSGLLDWHNEQARLAAEKAAQQAQNQSEILGIRTENLGLAQQRMDAQQRQFEEMQRLREAAAEQKMDPTQRALLESENKRLQEIDKAIFDLTGGVPPEEPGTVAKFIGWGTGKKTQYDSLMNQRNELLNSIRSMSPLQQSPAAGSVPNVFNVGPIQPPEELSGSLFGGPRLQSLDVGPIGVPSEGTRSERIRVKSPDGKTGTVSSENLQEALDAGYTRL